MPGCRAERRGKPDREQKYPLSISHCACPPPDDRLGYVMSKPAATFGRGFGLGQYRVPPWLTQEPYLRDVQEVL